MLDQVLAAFGVTPDYDLNVMTPGQTLFQSTARIIRALEQPFAALWPLSTAVFRSRMSKPGYAPGISTSRSRKN